MLPVNVLLKVVLLFLIKQICLNEFPRCRGIFIVDTAAILWFYRHIDGANNNLMSFQGKKHRSELCKILLVLAVRCMQHLRYKTNMLLSSHAID